MNHIYAVVIGFFLDLLLGDPQYSFHPIRGVGAIITLFEKVTRKIFPKTHKGELLAGAVTAIAVPLVICFLSYCILFGAWHVHRGLGILVESVMCYFVLATKSLKTESMKVYAPLKKGDLQEARQAVSMIVGRDTDQLTESEVAKAAVETVAENTSDGVIAPLLFLVLGGGVGGFLYKAINTMDSMLGYQNERYLYFGRVAAKLDDLANFVPARVSALIMIVAAKQIGLDSKQSYRIFRRDRFNHASPNSAQTEAACAGAMGVQLAGDTYYFGKLHHKPTIGDDQRPICIEDIPLVNKLMYTTAFLGLISFVLIYSAIYNILV